MEAIGFGLLSFGILCAVVGAISGAIVSDTYHPEKVTMLIRNYSLTSAFLSVAFSILFLTLSALGMQ